MWTEPLAVTSQVVKVLESLDIPYFVGGSLASAFHGVPRATMDADLVADMRLDQVEAFVERLGGAFYADPVMIQDAIRHRSSFNLIHLSTMFKVDVFIRKERAFDHSQFQRRAPQILALEPELTAYIASPEDIILAKLEWYRLGGEVSDRQWRDIRNILEVQADRLDWAYLRRWAAQLELSDLLERAKDEASPQAGLGDGE